MEVEQRFGSGAVVHEAVEGREERDAIGNRPVGRVGVRDPLALLEADAEGAEPLLAEDPLSLAHGDGLRLGIPPVREIPDALAGASPHDGDLAVHVQGLQHQADIAVAVPPVLQLLVRRPVLELA